MTNQQYQELIRLRRQEETFVYMSLFIKPTVGTVRELYEHGYFGKIPKNRFFYLLKKFKKAGVYDYEKNIDLGWLVVEE